MDAQELFLGMIAYFLAAIVASMDGFLPPIADFVVIATLYALPVFALIAAVWEYAAMRGMPA
ncbi:hypothetical protein [Natronolimnohabitans innermongolicus]|uniref:Uncharacterized protein n=1 Tax=Natronolimnohabitans innermongolicus JCM 12255 TaxID=1227499 RepID=L9XN88_9EURY|nr:hypothetical protein [Natronolimnohabitans innermongolicus]ELY62113.1 hypothetical protein C493_00820 [Natronolimnohabitans innermongolicus JCM 12255]